ncbi:hypothetical protein [uncultured Solobacterium sp.]|uniref:hypothetical protein n=1 Tax=uncultured Solobacterium sp. TaxID=747375 RepID=UPI0028ED0EC0|nr:hypothetical protein [uncultured Solobacterium sp.]
MKKALKPVAFLLVLVCLLIGTSYLVAPKGYENVYDIQLVNRKIDAVSQEKENTLDVLFTGDSEASNTFSPFQYWKEQGIASYNLGGSAQRLNDCYTVLEEVLKHQKPKVLVLEPNTLFRKNAVYNKEDSVLMMAEQIFPVLHHHNIYKSINLGVNLIGATKENAYADQCKGYYARVKIRPYQGSDQYMKTNKRETAIYPETMEYFEKIVQLCKENQVELIMVSSPSPKNWSDERHDVVQALCDKYGITYYDLNKLDNALALDWTTDTLDRGDHLNINGSKKVNAYFGKILKEKYHIPDHRGEADYAIWDQQAAELKLY